MAFQEPRLLPWRSVEDNVRLAAPEVDARRARRRCSPRSGSLEHRAHFPGELSLGLARRASLARALAAKPDLLLLDEPFVSLDPPLARAIRADLARLIEAKRADRRARDPRRRGRAGSRRRHLRAGAAPDKDPRGSADRSTTPCFASRPRRIAGPGRADKGLNRTIVVPAKAGMTGSAPSIKTTPPPP